jgi:hypothetical protein
MIEAELRALDKAEARMKVVDMVVESSKAKRSTAKQQADHSRTKNTALQVLLQRPDIYLTLIKTPLEVYDANNVMDATSKITVRGPKGANSKRTNPARAFMHQTGLLTVCKRVDDMDAVLKGCVNRIADRLHATAPIGKCPSTLPLFDRARSTWS